MMKTPAANRVHIAIYGNRNSGKSSLFNKIIGQDIAIVSDIKGTTTDPVKKSMELLPFGPVLFIDTAGLDDEGVLGDLRIQSSEKILQQADFAIYVHDSTTVDVERFLKLKKEFKRFNISYLEVFNKIDLLSEDELKSLKEKNKEALFVSTKNDKDILYLKDTLISILRENEEEETLIGDIVPYNGKVVLVVPIDSEAPKGRIILPQVQVIRDALDHGIKTYILRDTELEEGLKDLKDVDLVITDSQAFKEVSQMVKDIPITSFSILFARQKGDLSSFEEGVKALTSLKEGARVLISESCTHNHSHEDIGRVKIPTLINKKLGYSLNYDFKMGHDFPKELDYDLVIHCGSCMLNKKTMLSRISICKEQNIPITNYGIVLAYLNGILDESISMFKMKEE